MENITDKFIFFDSDSIYSNSSLTKFEINGQYFISGIQAFVYLKAKLFNDSSIATEVLMLKDPKEIRELGRRISTYNRDEWYDNRRKIMFKILYSKFTQNILLKEKILGTGSKHFVATGDRDFIWGIGMDINSPGIWKENLWQGENLLGELLGDVREMIRLIQLLSMGIYH